MYPQTPSIHSSKSHLVPAIHGPNTVLNTGNRDIIRLGPWLSESIDKEGGKHAKNIIRNNGCGGVGHAMKILQDSQKASLRRSCFAEI